MAKFSQTTKSNGVKVNTVAWDKGDMIHELKKNDLMEYSEEALKYALENIKSFTEAFKYIRSETKYWG